jgi:hypothetical protein
MGEAMCGGGEAKAREMKALQFFLAPFLSPSAPPPPPLASPILVLPPKIALSTQVSSLPMGAFIKYLHQVLLFLMLFT